MDLNLALIIGLGTFIFILIVDYFFILLPKYRILMGKSKKKKNKKTVIISEVQFLQSLFKLDTNKMDLGYMIRSIALINSSIIAFVVFVINLIPWETIWLLLIAFVLLFGLIYAIYEIFGRHLIKKGWSK